MNSVNNKEKVVLQEIDLCLSNMLASYKNYDGEQEMAVKGKIQE